MNKILITWKWIKMLVAGFLLSSLLSCSWMVVVDDYPRHNPETGKFIDAGRIHEADKRWLSSEIRRELKGWPSLPSGYKDSNAFWLDTFQRLRKYRDNPDRLIQYVIDVRRSLGLPEIVETNLTPTVPSEASSNPTSTKEKPLTP